MLFLRRHVTADNTADTVFYLFLKELDFTGDIYYIKINSPRIYCAGQSRCRISEVSDEKTLKIHYDIFLILRCCRNSIRRHYGIRNIVRYKIRP